MGFNDVSTLSEQRSDGPAARGCRKCETGRIAGPVVYRPEPLESPAEGNVLPCCAQPGRAVVLDLSHNVLVIK